MSIDPSRELSSAALRDSRLAHVKEEDRVVMEVPKTRRGSLARPVSEEEACMICCLLEKYELDYQRMALDRKLNPFQLNPRQLRRRTVNYLQWERAAFPELYAKAVAAGLDIVGADEADKTCVTAAPGTVPGDVEQKEACAAPQPTEAAAHPPQEAAPKAQRKRARKGD